jgi:phospholipid/cholesterol/gamma-HCH transport system substrate-binding protein
MNRRYLATIGLTVIVALVLVVRALLFLHPSPGDGGTQIHVRFQNVDKISHGTRVTFAGKPVGEVISVQLLPEVFDSRFQDARPIYSYEVVLSIDSQVKVYKSDEICVRSEGLMGERVIAILPKQVPEGGELHLIGPHETVFATPSGTAEEMLHEITVVAQKADRTIDSLFQASEQLNTLLCTLNSGHFGEKLTKITDKTITTLDSVDTLTSLLNEAIKGQGTLGKLMKDPSLYDSILECSYRSNQLVSDINTYGLLFHTNRDWQREMHRRDDETTAFSSSTLPQATRDRFVKISQNMSALHVAIAKAEKTLGRGSLCENQDLREEFSKGLSSIQQQLDNLSEVLHESVYDATSAVADEETDK